MTVLVGGATLAADALAPGDVRVARALRALG